jgi:hypothetical protein
MYKGQCRDALPYTASYSPANRSIRLLRDQVNSAAGNVQTYRVQLYNDQGYLKTASFTSNQENVLIPLNSLSSGNYYINVMDEQGNIVDRKLIPVY